MMTTEQDDEVLEGCGYEYDHDLRLTGEADGIAVYECRECGAEIIDDVSPDSLPS